MPGGRLQGASCRQDGLDPLDAHAFSGGVQMAAAGYGVFPDLLVPRVIEGDFESVMSP